MDLSLRRGPRGSLVASERMAKVLRASKRQAQVVAMGSLSIFCLGLYR